MDLNSENNFNTLPAGFNFGFATGNNSGGFRFDSVPTKTVPSFPGFGLQTIQESTQESTQVTLPQPNQLPRWNCMPPPTFSNHTISFNEVMESSKRRKENDISVKKESLFKELQLIRNQLETLTKSVDTMYSIISKLN